jgi:S-adenosylmethionine:tRNA ribosyltransferase-isomerase
VAVGSTTVRALETVMAERGDMAPCAGRTSLFIRPPYPFRLVNAMLTNFHLPRSTLLMMVSAFAAPPALTPEGAAAGRDRILRAYREAIRLRYRFFSYGDCMLIL